MYKIQPATVYQSTDIRVRVPRDLIFFTAFYSEYVLGVLVPAVHTSFSLYILRSTCTPSTATQQLKMAKCGAHQNHDVMSGGVFGVSTE